MSNPLSSVARVTDTPLLTHPAVTAVGVLEHGLDQLAAAHLWSLSDADTLVLRERLEGVRSRLDAGILAATREVDSRAAATSVAGAAGTAAWLTGRLRLHPGAAKTEVALAGAIADALGVRAAVWAVATLTAVSGAVVAVRMYETHNPSTVPAAAR